MPLSADDTSRLYSEAFARNAKTMLGEQSFAFAELRTQFDVLNMQMGILRDELAAAQRQLKAAAADVRPTAPQPPEA